MHHDDFFEKVLAQLEPLMPMNAPIYVLSAAYHKPPSEGVTEDAAATTTPSAILRPPGGPPSEGVDGMTEERPTPPTTPPEPRRPALPCDLRAWGSWLRPLTIYPPPPTLCYLPLTDPLPFRTPAPPRHTT